MDFYAGIMEITVRMQHDYIPNWPSVPGTVVEARYFHGKICAIKIDFYNGGKRWYGIESFQKNFRHYQHCAACKKGDKNEQIKRKILY